MNYQDLVLWIQNECNRYDDYFVAQIPDFITRGIFRLYNEAKSIGFQKVLNGVTFTAGEPILPKPNDWRETISLSYTIPGPPPTLTYLLPRTYEFCRTYAPIREVAQGVTSHPVFVADYDLPTASVSVGHFYLAPTPSDTYQYELIYLSIPKFDAVNNQNFLTDQYPLLLLAVCMVEAVMFLKDDERIPVFESSYNRALQGINKATQDRYMDRTGRRDKD